MYNSINYTHLKQQKRYKVQHIDIYAIYADCNSMHNGINNGFKWSIVNCVSKSGQSGSRRHVL